MNIQHCVDAAIRAAEEDVRAIERAAEEGNRAIQNAVDATIRAEQEALHIVLERFQAGNAAFNRQQAQIPNNNFEQVQIDTTVTQNREPESPLPSPEGPPHVEETNGLTFSNIVSVLKSIGDTTRRFFRSLLSYIGLFD